MEKICLCPELVWWVIMILLYFTCIVFEIASLSIPRWFSQGSGTYRWEGGLLKPYPSETLYKDKSCDSDFHGTGYCDMFDKLWIGGVIYFVFELISLVVLLLCIIFTILQITGKRAYIPVSAILIWVAVGAHLIGFATWAGLGKMLYKGSCDDFYTSNGDKPGHLCREEGATLGLLIVLYEPIIALLKTILWYNSRKTPAKEVQKIEIKYHNPNDNPEMSSRVESSREIVSESIDISK